MLQYNQLLTGRNPLPISLHHMQYIFDSAVASWLTVRNFDQPRLLAGLLINYETESDEGIFPDFCCITSTESESRYS